MAARRLLLGGVLCLLFIAVVTEAFKFRSRAQSTPPRPYEGRYSQDLAEQCARLSDARKREMQADLVTYAALHLPDMVVGQKNTTDPATGTWSLVDIIMTSQQRQMEEAVPYNALLSQCRKMGGHPRYRPRVRSLHGYDEMAMVGLCKLNPG